MPRTLRARPSSSSARSPSSTRSSPGSTRPWPSTWGSTAARRWSAQRSWKPAAAAAGPSPHPARRQTWPPASRGSRRAARSRWAPRRPSGSSISTCSRTPASTNSRMSLSRCGSTGWCPPESTGPSTPDAPSRPRKLSCVPRLSVVKISINMSLQESSDRYPFREIEATWQKVWEDTKAFKVAADPARPKFYCLEMFPYPSGWIHMGHVRNYAIGDVVARYKTMRGYNVLHPMGWDAFGLPAENAAIEHGVHPAVWTHENIDYMRAQLKKMGCSYDWDREFATCDPEYYRWEQLVFIRMFERGLAYRKRSTVNWCPDCQTVLANEQVEAGRCWRCDSEVIPKEVEGWFFKITDYAEELLAWCDRLPGWPEKVLTMQRNWIGRSEGAEVDFPLADQPGSLRVFTTRLDTIYGATFMVLAPEHPLVPELTRGTKHAAEVTQFAERI